MRAKGDDETTNLHISCQNTNIAARLPCGLKTRLVLLVFNVGVSTLAKPHDAYHFWRRWQLGYLFSAKESAG
jgi:hypothetical protein